MSWRRRAGKPLRWTLEDIDWQAFDPTKVDPELVKTVKAAALVEFNAPDYVAYLSGIFSDDSDLQNALLQWGEEETQHGRALAKWAKCADPSFDFDRAFVEFRKIQKIDTTAQVSSRGSRAGELISRCVVESGTSTFYSAIKETCEEPVLKQIAGLIAADEYAHFRLFYEQVNAGEGAAMGIFTRLRIALGRLGETDDEELSGAYYCANFGPGSAYSFDNPKTFADAYQKRVLGVYRRRHVARLVSMVAKVAGLHPQGPLVRAASAAVWQYLSFRRWRLERSAL